LISTEDYDKEKYLEMLLDSGEVVLGYLESMVYIDLILIKKSITGGANYMFNRREISKKQSQIYGNDYNHHYTG
jgi:hypothetical protein